KGGPQDARKLTQSMGGNGRPLAGATRVTSQGQKEPQGEHCKYSGVESRDSQGSSSSGRANETSSTTGSSSHSTTGGGSIGSQRSAGSGRERPVPGYAYRQSPDHGGRGGARGRGRGRSTSSRFGPSLAVEPAAEVAMLGSVAALPPSGPSCAPPCSATPPLRTCHGLETLVASATDLPGASRGHFPGNGGQERRQSQRRKPLYGASSAAVVQGSGAVNISSVTTGGNSGAVESAHSAGGGPRVSLHQQSHSVPPYLRGEGSWKVWKREPKQPHPMGDRGGKDTAPVASEKALGPQRQVTECHPMPAPSHSGGVHGEVKGQGTPGIQKRSDSPRCTAIGQGVAQCEPDWLRPVPGRRSGHRSGEGWVESGGKSAGPDMDQGQRHGWGQGQAKNDMEWQ
ncbi:unnamed protein product, partial [Discosporangium mesarthrocarpum]